MAAFCLSNHAFVAPPLSSVTFFSRHSRTLSQPSLFLLPLHRHHLSPLSYSISTFSLSLPSSPSVSYSRRRSFSSILAATDAAAATNEEEEEEESEDVEGILESEGDEILSTSFQDLVQDYKEALLKGDEKIVSEIESKLLLVESEKNELFQKASVLCTEITAGKEKYIRLQADFDNFRKRSENERLTIRTNAQGEVIESLLPMVDNFERAKHQMKPETEKEKSIDTSYQGIYKQLVEIMRSLNVAAVATMGEPFDPSLHEAIAREESEDYDEGIVIQEFRRGFLLGDRLLRPAMVKVSSGPGKKKSSAAAETASEQPATAAAETASEQPATAAAEVNE